MATMAGRYLSTTKRASCPSASRGSATRSSAPSYQPTGAARATTASRTLLPARRGREAWATGARGAPPAGQGKEEGGAPRRARIVGPAQQRRLRRKGRREPLAPRGLRRFRQRD